MGLEGGAGAGAPGLGAGGWGAGARRAGRGLGLGDGGGGWGLGRGLGGKNFSAARHMRVFAKHVHVLQLLHELFHLLLAVRAEAACAIASASSYASRRGSLGAAGCRVRGPGAGGWGLGGRGGEGGAGAGAGGRGRGLGAGTGHWTATHSCLYHVYVLQLLRAGAANGGWDRALGSKNFSAARHIRVYTKHVHVLQLLHDCSTCSWLYGPKPPAPLPVEAGPAEADPATPAGPVPPLLPVSSWTNRSKSCSRRPVLIGGCGLGAGAGGQGRGAGGPGLGAVYGGRGWGWGPGLGAGGAINLKAWDRNWAGAGAGAGGWGPCAGAGRAGAGGWDTAATHPRHTRTLRERFANACERLRTLANACERFADASRTL